MIVTCCICHKEVDVPKCRARNFHTCSVECRAQLSSITLSTKQPIVCPICGKTFLVKKSHVERRKTCSKKCFKVLKQEQMSGTSNHQYGIKGINNASHSGLITTKNGYAFIFVPDHQHADCNGRIRLHRYVVEVFGNVPSEYKDENGYLLDTVDVHHIDENPMNNDPSNLVALYRGEHVSYHNSTRKLVRDESNGRIIGVEKRGELLESLTANQQLSIDSNVDESSTTNRRVPSANAKDSNTDTSALLYTEPLFSVEMI